MGSTEEWVLGLGNHNQGFIVCGTIILSVDAYILLLFCTILLIWMLDLFAHFIDL